MSRSFLEDAIGGLYMPGRRYAFTNITDEDFTSYWAKTPITVKANETIEVSDATPIPGANMGQVLAVKMAMELTDKIMMTDVKVKETDYYKHNPGAQPQSYRAPNNVGVPNARKPIEDQILRQLNVDEDATEGMKQQILDSIRAGAEGHDEGVAAPRSQEEFAEIKKVETKAEPKKAVRTKKLS